MIISVIMNVTAFFKLVARFNLIFQSLVHPSCCRLKKNMKMLTSIDAAPFLKMTSKGFICVATHKKKKGISVVPCWMLLMDMMLCG